MNDNQPQPATAGDRARPHAVEIPTHLSITTKGAEALAAGEGYRLHLATIQKHAKKWAVMGDDAPVKSMMVAGPAYRLHRDDFLFWVQKQITKRDEKAAVDGRPRPQAVIDVVEFEKLSMKAEHLETELNRAVPLPAID